MQEQAEAPRAPTFLAMMNSSIPFSMVRDKWNIEDFSLGKLLHRSKTSCTYTATDKLTSTKVAIKAYRKDYLDPLSVAQVLREVEIHISLEHPNIAQMYAAFEDNDLLYLVLELCEGGDLYRRLKLGSRGGPTRLTEDEAAKFVIGPLLAALIYLHRRGIIHRDIKPENICVASNNQIKVIDFGLAINANKEKPVTRLGTLEYIAPEVIICPEKVLPEEYKECKELWYSESCDIWGCGILASELMTGYAPFEKDESEGICRQDQFQDFKHHLLQDDPEIPSHLSLTAASFIKLALTKDPASRPAASELIHHPFLQPYHEAIQLQLADHVSRTISCPQMHATEPISIQRLMAASGNASSPVGSPQMKNFMHSPLSSSLGHLHEDLASAMPQLKDVPSQSCPLGYSSVHRSMSRLSVAEGNKGNLTGLMLTTPLTQPDM